MSNMTEYVIDCIKRVDETGRDQAVWPDTPSTTKRVIEGLRKEGASEKLQDEYLRRCGTLPLVSPMKTARELAEENMWKAIVAQLSERNTRLEIRVEELEKQLDAAEARVKQAREDRHKWEALVDEFYRRRYGRPC